MQKIKLLTFVVLTSFFSFSSAEEASSLTESKLTDSQIRHAESWQLSRSEYKKYLEIMKSPRAYFTPNLDKNPLLALALESKSEEERAKYADKWVQIQFDNNVKVIGWQLDVNEAWKRNYPGMKRFVYKKPGLEHQKISEMFKPINDPLPFNLQKPRAQLYVKLSNCKECIEAFNVQMKELQSGAIEGIDVQFIGDVDKKAIVQWAISQNIKAEDVNEHRIITLNVSDKKISKLPFVELK